MRERYFFHIRDGEYVSVDDEGMEFETPREADLYGAQVARDIGEDDRDYPDTELSVVDSRGHVVARHPSHRQLPNCGMKERLEGSASLKMLRKHRAIEPR